MVRRFSTPPPTSTASVGALGAGAQALGVVLLAAAGPDGGVELVAVELVVEARRPTTRASTGSGRGRRPPRRGTTRSDPLSTTKSARAGCGPSRRVPTSSQPEPASCSSVSVTPSSAGLTRAATTAVGLVGRSRLGAGLRDRREQLGGHRWARRRSSAGSSPEQAAVARRLVRAALARVARRRRVTARGLLLGSGSWAAPGYAETLGSGKTGLCRTWPETPEYIARLMSYAIDMPTVEKVARTNAGLASELRISVMRLRRRLALERHPDNELSLGAMAVLGALYRQDGQTVGELARGETRASRPSMTRTVGCLVDDGYAARSAHDTDGRVGRRTPHRPGPRDRPGRPAPPRRLADPAARRARPRRARRPAPRRPDPRPAGQHRLTPSDLPKAILSPTFRSLHNANYRLYAAGGVVSNTGTWMQRVAQDWLVLQLSDGSGTAIGITTGLQFLPFLLLAPVAGLVADRMPKQRLLQLTNLGMAAARRRPRPAGGHRHRRELARLRAGVRARHRRRVRRAGPAVVRVGAGLRRTTSPTPSASTPPPSTPRASSARRIAGLLIAGARRGCAGDRAG